MSISDEVSRLETAKANLRTAINNKGVSVSETATLDTYATAVNSIATASSVDLSGYMPKSGGTFTGIVKFNETDSACINFDSGIYINKTNGSTLLGSNGTTAWVGMPDAALTFRGSAARPSYVYNGTTYSLARTSDITTYTLPTATSSVLGGVKIGSNITVSSGTISLTKANVTSALGYTPPTSSLELTDTQLAVLNNTNLQNGYFVIGGGAGTSSFWLQTQNNDKMYVRPGTGISFTKNGTDDVSINVTYTTETWTFTLSDGSTVTKNVCIG